MTSLKNSVQLIGRLGSDVTLIEKSNYQLAYVNMATTEIFKKRDGEKKEETQWHKLVFWDNQASLIATLGKKGIQLAISGKIKYDEYEDKSGVKRKGTSITVTNFMVLSKKPSVNSRLTFDKTLST